MLAAFVVIESRVESPVLPLSIFRLRTLAGANLAGLLLGASFFAFIFIGTLYMQQVLHYSALQTGVAWLATSLTSIALAGLSQWLVTRGGAKIVMAIGMTLIGAVVIWATQVPVHGHFLENVAGPMVIVGAGTAFSFIPISIGALAGVAARRAGLASGLLNTSQQLGGAIGIAIASSVAASHTQALLHAGNAAPAALTGGFQQALWVLGAIALLAVPAIFALVRRNELSDAATKTTIREPQPAPTGRLTAPRLQGRTSAPVAVADNTNQRSTEMGKIVISENVSLDGVVEDPTGEEGFRHGGWFSQFVDKDREAWAKVEFEEALDAEAMLLGRRSYEYFAVRWQSRNHTGWAIWMRLPQVSSNTAVVTGPIAAGSCVNFTPRARSRSNSAVMSLTAKDVNGIPSLTSAALNGLTAGWESGSSTSSVPSGSSGETTVSQRCSPSGISVFFSKPSTSV